MQPSAAAGAVITTACLNVAVSILLLATAVGLSRLDGGGEVGVSSAILGEEQPTTGHDAAQRWRRRLQGYEDDRCAGGYDAVPGIAVDGPRGYVDYLYLFYCVLGGERRRALGYGAMAAWLGVLFYLLGDTAAVYFCSSLEGLSRQLGLPPAVAGATLLSLGNGAPDALSTVASFASGSGSAVLGLNGVLGGALFVSSAVLGVVGLRLGGRGVAVDRAGFFRDAAFLLVALAAVALVLAAGEVNIWGAVAFTSIYLVYVLAVAFTPDRWSGRRRLHEEEAEYITAADRFSEELHNIAGTKFYAGEQEEPLLITEDTTPLLEHYPGGCDAKKRLISRLFWMAVRALDVSLRLPRRLTIPDASKERWSKPTAVTAATLAPVLLSWLCRHAVGRRPLVAVLVGGLSGLSLGTLSYLTTDPAAPPTRFLAAWHAGGFAMSVAWSYAVANEVLSLLVSAGAVLSVDAAALGVTVLAWGNSLGDVVTNVAVASSASSSRGGGAQVAVSGCYGGPVFDVLVGLGLSMLLSCWAGYPRPLTVPREPGLYRTLGFAAAGLVWAALMLARRGTRVDRTLGLGLLAVYLCFLCINIWHVLLGPTGRE